MHNARWRHFNAAGAFLSLRLALENHRNLVGFAMFGAAAGLVYAAAMMLMVDVLRMPVFTGSVIAFAAAIPVSYFGNRWWTYRSRNVLAPEALRFLATAIANLFLTSAVVHVASAWLGLATVAAIGVAFVAAPIVSFVLYEVWVFKQRRETGAAPGRPG